MERPPDRTDSDMASSPSVSSKPEEVPDSSRRRLLRFLGYAAAALPVAGVALTLRELKKWPKIPGETGESFETLAPDTLPHITFQPLTSISFTPPQESQLSEQEFLDIGRQLLLSIEYYLREHLTPDIEKASSKEEREKLTLNAITICWQHLVSLYRNTKRYCGKQAFPYGKPSYQTDINTFLLPHGKYLEAIRDEYLVLHTVHPYQKGTLEFGDVNIEIPIFKVDGDLQRKRTYTVYHPNLDAIFYDPEFSKQLFNNWLRAYPRLETDTFSEMFSAWEAAALVHEMVHAYINRRFETIEVERGRMKTIYIPADISNPNECSVTPDFSGRAVSPLESTELAAIGTEIALPSDHLKFRILPHIGGEEHSFSWIYFLSGLLKTAEGIPDGLREEIEQIIAIFSTGKIPENRSIYRLLTHPSVSHRHLRAIGADMFRFAIQMFTIASENQALPELKQAT